MQRLLTLIILLLLICCIAPQFVIAEDGLVCAAVVPCSVDKDGNYDGKVLPPFDQGGCKDHYRAVCYGLVVNDVGQDLVECEDSKDELKQENKKQTRIIKRLRSRIKKSRRR
jgi:hypothetical protein